MYRGNITLRGKNKEIAIDGSKIIGIISKLLKGKDLLQRSKEENIKEKGMCS